MTDDVWFNREKPLVLPFHWLEIRCNNREYFPGLIRLRHRICGTGESPVEVDFREHAHLVYHFIFCTKGRNGLIVDGQPKEISKGQILVIDPGVPHNLNPKTGDSARYYAFTFQYLCNGTPLNWTWPRVVAYLTGQTAINETFIAETESFEEHLHWFLNDLTSPASPNLPGLGAHFMDFLQDFFIRPHAVRKNEPNPLYRSYPERAVAFIKDNYRNKISIDDLCEVVNLSKGHFIELFRKELGMTPMKYLNAYRLERAEYLLCHTNLTNREIAFQCGFASDSYFNKTFRRKMGISPGVYRAEFRD